MSVSALCGGTRLLRAFSPLFLAFPLLISCGGAESPSDSQTSSLSEGRYSLVAAHSGKCLDVPNANFAASQDLQQWDCNGTNAQTFQIKHITGDSYEIITADGKLALDIEGNSTASGANIHLWNINGQANQLFRFEASGSGYVIRAQSSNLVFDVDSASTASGARIQQWAANGGDNQRWILTPAGATAKTFPITSNNRVYFTGADNQREKRFNVTMPDNFDGYNKAVLHLKLSCPDNHCDAWDRVGTFGVYSQAHGGRFLELLRFMTPYGQGGTWDLDVTDLLPLFQGKQDYRLFIDTWVGPGNSAGNGWVVDLSLSVTPGASAQRTSLIVPILSMADVAYGNPSSPTARTGDIVPLLGYKSAKIYSIITGHGQGNGENCAEFCAKTHSVKVGAQTFSQKIWRDNCSTTTSQSQGGNAQSSRAGWCPGDIVHPWTADVTNALSTATGKATYDVQAYENMCRPDSSSCRDCVFGTSCAYDGGMHTDPKYYVTSYLIYKN